MSEAVKWGMKAAQNGSVHVQALLANALLEGNFESEPVEQDREKAILWLKNAANKGLWDSKEKTCRAWLSKWFMKASEPVITDAMVKLGHLHEYGMGV